MKRDHVFNVLIARGFFESKDDATRWILAGKVFVDGERIENSGIKIAVDAAIDVRGLGRKYVGRGGYKLEGALDDFGVNVVGLVAIDAGASTGGFTDCLLQRGARQVYAVDVGFGQLAGKLRADPRVINMEKTNIGDVAGLDPIPACAVADLSYLSLTQAIPILSGIVAPGADILCLVKPLFETTDAISRRTGVIANNRDFTRILLDLVQFTADSGLVPLGITNSRVTGSNGTLEFFLHIRKGRLKTKPALRLEIERAVERAVVLEGS